VRALGARIVRRFPFRAARVMMPAARVPELARVAVQLQSVPDPRQANWEMSLMYRRKLRPADTAEWRALGGRVTYVRDHIRTIYGGIFGVLPDSAVRILSERHWLRAIAANTIGCVGDASGHVSPNIALQPTSELRSAAAEPPHYSVRSQLNAGR
jgi:hypothetical protein